MSKTSDWWDDFMAWYSEVLRKDFSELSASWFEIRRSHCRRLCGRTERPEARRKTPEGPCAWGRKGRI
jgi:hypothetical protein